MKTNKMVNRFLLSAMILSSISLASLASTPLEEPHLECGMPLEVYEATANPVPEGIAYEYVEDAEGNFVLVEVDSEEFWECTLPLDVYEATEYPVPEGVAYEYVVDEEGNFVLVEEFVALDFTEAFDPEGEPMPEGAYAMPVLSSPETSEVSWFAQLLFQFFNLFST